MAQWDHRCSEGCKFCYIHKGDTKRGEDTNVITKTDKFYIWKLEQELLAKYAPALQSFNGLMAVV